MSVRLSGTFLADGSSSSINSYGRDANITATGDFGGGTLSTQVSMDGGASWIIPSTFETLSADGSFNYWLPDSALIRLTLSGSSSPNINYWLS